MSLINLQLPLDAVNRVVSALERIANSVEKIEKWIVVPVVEPTYTKQPHVTQVNYELIDQIEQLNAERVRRGEPTFSTTEAIAHLRRDIS